MVLLLASVILLLLVIFLKYLSRNYELTSLTKKIKTLDGSPLERSVAFASGFWGSSYGLISASLEEIFYIYRNFAKKFGRNYIQYYIARPVYNIIIAEDAELVLNDNRLLTKGYIYTLLHPFLKTGLLTSTGKKWHSRRRLLTPAFHFNILEQFMEIFKRESEKFVNTLNAELLDDKPEAEISLSELIPRFALNNICETALGVSLDDHLDGDDYRRHITVVEEVLVKRIQNPIMANDIIFHTFGYGKCYLETMKKLHKFSSGIIAKRRLTMEKEMKQNNVSESFTEENDSIYRRQRYAMLDTMLRAEKDGLIDHAGICEEVDTFMFEGFDTTSMSLIFTLMNLALYPDMQRKCLQEIELNISNNLNDLEMNQLNNLKYLDCFIKESQRLYPPVPIIIRECTSDIALANNLFLPKRTQILIHIFDIQRNPKYFKNPDEFRPERFISSESEKHPPFAFIPFSAGQRNCIGQKFALLEMKTLIVYILKNYKLEAVTQPDMFKFSTGLLLRTKTDIKIKVIKR